LHGHKFFVTATDGGEVLEFHNQPHVSAGIGIIIQQHTPPPPPTIIIQEYHPPDDGMD
jgi:hypothetical protein